MIDQAQRLREMARARPQTPNQDRQGANERKAGRLRAVAVTSGKGGVGKTNIALMLSISLALLKKKVLLFDADLGLANVHILLGLAPRRNLSDVAEGRCGIDEVLCPGPGGIMIVPGASGMESMANADAARLGALRRSLEELETRYDFAVVDTSAGIGAVTTEFAASADLSLCVMTPEPTSLADAYAMIKVLYEKHSPAVEVIVNMAASDTEGQGAVNTLNQLTERFLGRTVRLAAILPVDREVPRLVRQQKVMLVEHPGSAIAVRIGACARRMCGLAPATRTGFFSRLLGMRRFDGVAAG